MARGYIPFVSISEHELLRKFGTAVETRNAALFVGAGLSREAGYPDWTALLEEPRKRLHLPASVTDLPLVAQYCAQAEGRESLNGHILTSLAAIDARPGVGHGHIAHLPVDEIWTTNYDRLIETAQ
jgi:hypothetical protein